jgi:hypothetical protein
MTMACQEQNPMAVCQWVTVICAAPSLPILMAVAKPFSKPTPASTPPCYLLISDRIFYLFSIITKSKNKGVFTTFAS